MKTTKQLAAMQNKLFNINIENGLMSIYSKAAAEITKSVDLPDGIYSEALIRLGDLPEKAESTDPIEEKVINIIANVPNFDIIKFAEMSKYVGNDEIRPQLMGVFYDAESSKLVATDAHVLKFVDAEIGVHSFIMRAENIKEVATIAKFSPIITVNLIEENRLQVIFENITYICTLESGRYPSWQGVVPKYDNGRIVKISKATQSEMMQFCKDLLKSKGGKSIKNQANQVFFNLDNNTATITDIDLNAEKSWSIESTESTEPNTCGLIMPIMVDNNGCKNYFGINMYFLDRANTEQLYYNSPTKALLIPSAEQPKNTAPKKQEVKKTEEPAPEQAPEETTTQVDEYPEPEPIKHTATKAISTPQSEPAPEVVSRNIKVIDYSDKAIAVIGDTKQVKEELKAAGGRFNAHLKCGAGWIFSKKKTDIVSNIIK